MSNKTKVSFDVIFDKHGHVEFLPPVQEGELPDGVMEELCRALHKLKNNRNEIVNHNYSTSIVVCDKYKLDEILLLKVGKASESPTALYYVFPNRRGSMVYEADCGHLVSLASQDIYRAFRDQCKITVANEDYANLYKEALEGCTIKPL